MQSPLLDNLLQQNAAGLPVKDFLQQLVEEHPYFTPARFFLLQQLTEEDSAYAGQAATTALLFNNPHWLQFQLQQVPQPAVVKQTPVIPMYAENTDNDDDTAQLVSETVTSGHFIQPGNEATSAEAIEALEPASVTEEPVREDTPAETVTDAPEPFAENTDNDDDTAVLVNKETPGEEMPGVKIDLAASLKAAENENAPAFEPMHLVDYFASQGIKLSEEVQTADKLGRQLKSFTEWLKTMKKVHVPDNHTTAGGSEAAIQVLAEKSNAENEVITEAMAEVLVQQGKAAKAIELYQKLSLLNPGKSAYFAAKIDNLKEQ